ncbi:hypothetical protein A3G67_01910 [Candidatus Roizmanbacteria bacterium RIFCSPLOWO2_12_FULL_40_12]|uniref:Alpha/beta hydrolase n=1 Tax=Candidatus Roizmanbacteria bacterium RIFCSPLOWO2_01_FULL_40_42 TaxID=1802066 RepID=A0A1F7J3L6_9BACT|nr:MAG: hypothetical protein A2779_01030 [Candidatus Roizmanbacteria bacterium RIFCSPHIGHO2_01_FULL_40_98]OGK28950.1 MAG: hypothetical protein A3C31_01670 [Candidatus Roizmanbacteria bacterium RIFCSPHIGHO2_02_FULL_40_53]OGK29584.1 MAG: hypothetical protein A2W49_03870 [Candidatus Roizmanbacteria bacterium RIFCSPHIGHO2_12_41_18]OGK36711.1 MAG: hypothetical protein A3E69_03870 [Candidatus Roizmanbacteria bacterium RIFCSPHIGHO2_12_FULL_40_130]OGK50179.1 MAG: hypothetical protein A3B50_00125 [Candi
MKNAEILHGTRGNSQAHWFPWLKGELEGIGYKVWVPDLPQADKPNIQRYNEFLSNQKPFDLNEETILIGHSSGAVAILGFLQDLPDGTKIHAAYLIGSFKDGSNRDDRDELFEKPFDFEKIKSRADKFVLVHSDDDPFCPLDHAEFLAEKLGGQLVVIPGQKHFTIDTAGEAYKQFPELLKLIKDNE